MTLEQQTRVRWRAAWVFVISLVLAALLATPSPALAGAAQSQPAQTCERILGYGATVLPGVDSRVASLRERHAAALRRQAGRWAEQDARRAEEAARAKRRLAERVAALKPVTDAEREAVAAFVTAVEAAIDARTLAIRAAIAEFRAGVAEALASTLDDMVALLVAHKDAVAVHVARARAECERGVPPGQALQAVQAGIRESRKALADALAALPSMQDVIRPLERGLRSDIEAAIAEFRSAVQAAAAALKVAFGEGSGRR